MSSQHSDLHSDLWVLLALPFYRPDIWSILCWILGVGFSVLGVFMLVLFNACTSLSNRIRATTFRRALAVGFAIVVFFTLAGFLFAARIPLSATLTAYRFDQSTTQVVFDTSKCEERDDQLVVGCNSSCIVRAMKSPIHGMRFVAQLLHSGYNSAGEHHVNLTVKVGLPVCCKHANTELSYLAIQMAPSRWVRSYSGEDPRFKQVHFIQDPNERKDLHIPMEIAIFPNTGDVPGHNEPAFISVNKTVEDLWPRNSRGERLSAWSPQCKTHPPLNIEQVSFELSCPHHGRAALRFGISLLEALDREQHLDVHSKKTWLVDLMCACVGGIGAGGILALLVWLWRSYCNRSDAGRNRHPRQNSE